MDSLFCIEGSTLKVHSDDKDRVNWHGTKYECNTKHKTWDNIDIRCRNNASMRCRHETLYTSKLSFLVRISVPHGNKSPGKYR